MSGGDFAGTEAGARPYIRLEGYDAEPTTEGLRLTLYWQALGTPPRDDYHFFVHLLDAWDFPWGQAEVFSFPSSQWRPGDLILTRVKVPVGVGAPPGEYVPEVGVYAAGTGERLVVLNETGQTQGTAVKLEAVYLPRPPQPGSVAELNIQHRREVALAEGLVLLGDDRWQKEVRPGDTLFLTLYWQARQDNLPDVPLTLRLEGAAEEKIVLWEGAPVHGEYPFSRWETGQVVVDRYGLRVPVDTAAGEYGLVLEVLGERLNLGQVEVAGLARSFTVPPMEQRVDANLGDEVTLLGYDLEREEIEPGGEVRVVLYWQARQEMDESYTVFVHLLNPQGVVVDQEDHPPVRGTYPTTLWVEGEVVRDEYVLSVPAEAEAGVYPLEVGMYLLETMERLPVLGADGTPVGDHILLKPVKVRRP